MQIEKGFFSDHIQGHSILLVTEGCIYFFISCIRMDSYNNRVSTLFTAFTTALFVVATLNHFTSYFYQPAPVGTITPTGWIEYSNYKSYDSDQVKFEFDLAVDLRSEYNWNVNQIYVFVVATYETDKNTKNEVVIYDRILKTLKDFKFTFKEIKNKYMLRDEFKGTLAGRTIELKIRYQLMPIFGFLRIKELPVTGKITVPKEYNSGTKR